MVVINECKNRASSEIVSVIGEPEPSTCTGTRIAIPLSRYFENLKLKQMLGEKMATCTVVVIDNNCYTTVAGICRMDQLKIWFMHAH